MTLIANRYDRLREAVLDRLARASEHLDALQADADTPASQITAAAAALRAQLTLLEKVEKLATIAREPDEEASSDEGGESRGGVDHAGEPAMDVGLRFGFDGGVGVEADPS